MLFLPLSLGAGFLVAGLVHWLTTGGVGASTDPLAYAGAFLSGLAYGTDGTFEKVAERVYLVTPSNAD